MPPGQQAEDQQDQHDADADRPAAESSATLPATILDILGRSARRPLHLRDFSSGLREFFPIMGSWGPFVAAKARFFLMDEHVRALVSGLHITGSTSIVTAMARSFSPAMPATGRLASIIDARRGVAGGAWLIARAVAIIVGDGAGRVPCAAALGPAGRRSDARAGGRASLGRRAGVGPRAWCSATLWHLAGPGPALAGRLASRRAAPLECGTTAGRQLDDAGGLIGHPARSSVDCSRAHRHRRRSGKSRGPARHSSSARVSLYGGTASGRAAGERMAPRRTLCALPLTPSSESVPQGPRLRLATMPADHRSPRQASGLNRRLRERGAAAIAGGAASLPP